jgi:hypothetical protein
MSISKLDFEGESVTKLATDYKKSIMILGGVYCSKIHKPIEIFINMWL